MRRVPVGVAVLVSLSLVGCKPKQANVDSSKVDSTKKTDSVGLTTQNVDFKALRAAGPKHTQGSVTWYGNLSPKQQAALQAPSVDPALNWAQLKPILAAKPKSGKHHRIRVLAKTGGACTKDEVRLDVETTDGGGAIDYRTYKISEGKFFLATITNEHAKCTAKKYEIGPKQTVYWLVVVDADGNITSTMVDSDTGDPITVPANLGMTPCNYNSQPPAGDEATPKKYKNGQKIDIVCDHKIPVSDDAPVTASAATSRYNVAGITSTFALAGRSLRTLGRRLMPFLDYDDWSMWIACGADCCYADP